MLGTISGAIAGLASITPAAGYVGIWPAIIIGAAASILCFIAVSFIKRKFNYDDSLDAFGVHGISGFWGTIAVGLFASKTVNAAGPNGLFAGNPKQLLIQVIAVAATFAYALICTYILLKIVDTFMGIRATQENEAIGLDLSEHNERAYTMLE
jgi:Amt family ammonium transporter